MIHASDGAFRHSKLLGAGKVTLPIGNLYNDQTGTSGNQAGWCWVKRCLVKHAVLSHAWCNQMSSLHYHDDHDGS